MIVFPWSHARAEEAEGLSAVESRAATVAAPTRSLRIASAVCVLEGTRASRVNRGFAAVHIDMGASTTKDSGMKKSLLGWLEADPPSGARRRAYCSAACAREAGVRATKRRWTHPHAAIEPSGLCSRCGHTIIDVTVLVLEREPRSTKG